jgi:hypothetical protein
MNFDDHGLVLSVSVVAIGPTVSALRKRNERRRQRRFRVRHFFRESRTAGWFQSAIYCDNIMTIITQQLQ